MELTDPELRTLKTICDTIIPSIKVDGPFTDFYSRCASDIGVDKAMAETIQSKLEVSFAEQFRTLLRAFDSRVYNLVLSGRPVKFTRMSAPERTRYLQAWRDSAVPLKRTAFQALKRLSCFLYYSLADESGVNPSWSAIGYIDGHEAKHKGHPEEMKISSILPEGPISLSCDVCIIGSGAGGSVIAYELSRVGLNVLVIEGGAYGTADTFKQSELEMMQKIFEQHGTASTKDLSFTLLAGRCAGGGTTVNWNTCLRPPGQVLQEWEAEHGIAGLTGQEFQSYTDEVWNTLKVNRTESQMNWNNKALWEGCKALGYREGVDFETIERNAVGCQERCDSCMYGCVYSCKQATILNYLPMACHHGARFIFDTTARHIVIESGRVKGVEATHFDGARRVPVSITAKVVVAACGGLETPALLLRSDVRHAMVGRHLLLHPTAAMGGVFPTEVRAWGGPPQTVAVRKFSNLDGTGHGFWIEAAPAHPGLFAFSIPWRDGKTHKDFVRDYYARTTATIILLREWGAGEVTIDKHGAPSVSYKLAEKDRENMMSGMEATARILAAAGASEVWTTHNDPVIIKQENGKVSERQLEEFSRQVRSRGIRYNRIMLFSAHIMGSCRMGSDPSRAPTKSNGELYDVENLFIGDATVLPTSPGVNPMITIMAMARRTAEFIKLKFRG